MLSVPAVVGQVEEYLEAFESVLARDGAADLADFLPAPGNEKYRSVLREMIRVDLDHRWSRGRRPVPLAGYRRRFPEAFADQEDRAAIAFEEYRLRVRAGERPSPEEYEREFGIHTAAWPLPHDLDESRLPELLAAPAAAEGDELPPTHLVADSAPERPAADAVAAGVPLQRSSRRDVSDDHPVIRFPEVGATFLDFRLLKILGTGAFGRVYLAEQAVLANRPVALKITTGPAGESQRLAQLQHSNIVPIYSTHDAGAFQAVCMPYFGATTLADVIKAISHSRSFPTSGRELISTLQGRKSTLADVPESSRDLDADEEELADTLPAVPECKSQVVLDKLAGFNYVDAVLWLTERLADGLAHAHERGILHCDLKPANVLLSDDGQPMLLDFNLAMDAKLLAAGKKKVRGGTVAYMAPEHLQALSGVKCQLDGRSDVYALGLIVFELLAGQQPSPPPEGMTMSQAVSATLAARRGPVPRLRPLNASVSPAVEAIVRRCLEPDPARRYPTARALQEDLQCHLANLPLKHTREPSLRERGGKWLRRHPRFLARAVAVTAGLALVGGGALWTWRGQQLRRFEASETLQAFRKDADEARFHLAHVNDKAFREQGLRKCQAALDRYQALTAPSWRELPAVQNLSPEERERLPGEVGELLLIYTDASLPAPNESTDTTARFERALQQTMLAKACFETQGAPRAWGLQRAHILERLDRPEEARAAKAVAEQLPMRTAYDLYLTAKQHFQAGRYREALPLLQQAADLDPSQYWTTFYLARCYDQDHNDQAAIETYRTCSALRPTVYGPWYNRGLAQLRLKNYRRALTDFDRAATLWIDHVGKLQSDHAELYFNRALAHHGLKQWKEALTDLNQSEELGCAVTRIYFLRARVRDQLGDKDGAERDRSMGLSKEPTDDLSWNARGFARLGSDPKGALSDFEKALEQNPRSRPALENQASVLSEALGRTKDAIGALDKLLALYPDNVAARASRGVLHARLGQRKAALEDAEESLLRNADPPNQYQVAGIYALTSRTDPDDARQAFAFLGAALRAGYGLDMLESDGDLDPIRNRPEFLRLEDGAKSLLRK